MRIVFISPEFVTEPYFSGGLANYLNRVTQALVHLGHKVHIITLSEINQDEFFHKGVRVHRITSGRLRTWLNRFTGYRIRGSTAWIEFSFKAYQKLRQLEKQHFFHIIQFPNSRGCGLFSIFFLRIPYVTRISCYRPVWNEQAAIKRNLDEKVTELLEWVQLGLSPYIYAPSHRLERMLAEQANIKRVQVIRTPFYFDAVDWDTSVYDEHLKDKDYLLFFGRFQLHKGFHVLAQALPEVLQAHPDCYAALVGLDTQTHIAPSMKEHMRSLCGRNANRLIFIGQTPHNQLYPIIAGTRLVVLPSLIDNLPNACLEAMALGKPVIGTLGASFEEVLTDEENGFLVPIGDAKILAAKINEAWTHPRLDEIGRAARCKVQEFAPERTVQELLTYFRDILNSHHQ